MKKLLFLFFLSNVIYSQTIEKLLIKVRSNPHDISTIHKVFEYQQTLIDTDRDSAKVIFKEIIPYLNRLNNDELNFKLHHELSRIGYLDSDYKGAYDQAKLALNFSKKLKSKIFEARASRLMMVMCHRLNNDLEAINYAIITGQLLENSTDTLMLSSTYNSLASFFSDYGDNDKALAYSLKSIEIAKMYKDVKGLLGAINNASTSYMNLRQYSKAEVILLEQIKIATLNNKPRSIERAYTNLNEIFVSTDNLKKLNIYFPKFRIFVESNGEEIMKEDNWSNFYDLEAKYHLYNLRFDKAEESINKGLNIAEKSSYKHQLLNLYYTKSEIYTASHRFAKATIYTEKADSLDKSFESLELKKYGDELEAKYDLTKKQNEILQKDMSLQKSKNSFWLLGSGFLLFVTFAGFGFYFYRKKQAVKNLETEIATQKRERKRIADEMHDELGGNLTSLMYLAHQLKMETPDNTKVNKVLNTSSDISSNINEIIWALNQEKNSLKDWVFYTKGGLIEMLENSELAFTFEIPDDIPDRTLTDIEKRNLYLVVKEMVNNAIKHSNASHIVIQMCFNDGLKFKIKDNGIGIEVSKDSKVGKGNGMANVIRRMADLGGKISWNKEGGTTVQIDLT